MKKIFLSFLFLPCVLNAAVEPDLVKGVDLTATNYRPASLYNQLVDNGTIGASNKGGIIRQSTSPNMGDNPRYTNFIYVSNSPVSTPTLMLWNGSGWVPGLVGANSVNSSNIMDGSITAGKLAGSSVFGTNIAGNTIQATNLADGSVYGDKIANNGVWQGKFYNNAIRGIDITNRTIDGTNLIQGTITATEMGANSIQTSSLTNLGVTTEKIALTNITRDLMRDQAISGTQITNNTIAATNIADLAIDPRHISTNMPTSIAWGVYTNSGVASTVLRGANVTVAYAGVSGLTTVTFVTPPATINYGVIASGVARNAMNNFVAVTNKTTTSFQLRTTDLTGTPWNNNEVTFQVLY